MEAFRKLGISEEILGALKELKFETPTEIQEKTIPTVLEGKDIIAGAATGSGKTLAFGAGIIQTCKKGNGVQALVLTPTRELAMQITKNLKMFSKYKPLEITTVYGGVAIGPQIEDLEYADVVVGTPGRILDHMSRRTISLENVKILVLDEADRMLDMGFIDDVRKIMERCPSHRQNLLFSATINKGISGLVRDFMTEAKEIFAETEVDPSKLTQVYYDVEDNEKFSLLVHFLKHDKSGLVMVFCNTQRNTDFVAENLKLNGINALAIHGGHSQNQRTRTMKDFHSKDVEVLVCTDVAARGLDIKGVSHVYNYDSADEPSKYVHRIGRTARAGTEGKAVNIIGPRDYDYFGRIKREHPEIERQEAPPFERARIGFMHKPRFGGRREGGRSFGGRGGHGRERQGHGGGYRSGDREDRGERSEGRHSNRSSRFSRRFSRGSTRPNFRGNRRF